MSPAERLPHFPSKAYVRWQRVWGFFLFFLSDQVTGTERTCGFNWFAFPLIHFILNIQKRSLYLYSGFLITP